MESNLETAAAAFEAALETLASSPSPGADGEQGKPIDGVYDAVDALALLTGGLEVLSDRTPQAVSAGVLAGGPWEDPAKLLPHLVRGGLLADRKTAAAEVLSELRMLAMATDRLEHDALGPDDAREFLRQVLVLNLSLLTPSDAEDERERPGRYQRARNLLQFLLHHLSPGLVRDALASEIDGLCSQRPILTRRARSLIERVSVIPGTSEHRTTEERLDLYRLAIGEPSPLSQAHRDPTAFQTALESIDETALDQEVRSFATSLRLTGLGNPYHALLLRHLSVHDPSRLSQALGLNEVGAACLSQHSDTVRELIGLAIRVETCDALYGLAGLLERGLLERRVVKKGLLRLATVSLHHQAKKALMSQVGAEGTVTANALLTAGALSVLGQPLGVGQGNNPTCQSARGVSLWSMHAPGYLLNLLIRAARDGSVRFEFEGTALKSEELTGGLAPDIDPNLDPVSLVLVPHLDKIYDAMARHAAGRSHDPHRWVNPAFYGRWVPSGFACAVDEGTRQISAFGDFVRQFFATHHPAFNDGDELLYPNPVGILVTSVHGRLLGAHAVSLVRIDADPQGELRCYFYNPNGEGRQDWGRGVVVSVSGCGEIPGESSLPFAQFASRLYAFHFHAMEGGDPEAVPDAVVAAVTEESKLTWGMSYQWSDTSAPTPS